MRECLGACPFSFIEPADRHQAPMKVASLYQSQAREGLPTRHERLGFALHGGHHVAQLGDETLLEVPHSVTRARQRARGAMLVQAADDYGQGPVELHLELFGRIDAPAQPPLRASDETSALQFAVAAEPRDARETFSKLQFDETVR